MIFGRNTVIWMGAITVTLQFLKQVVVAMFPAYDHDTVELVFDGLTAVIGAWIALVANTSTTPVADPRLPIGTIVSVTGGTGEIVGQQEVMSPKVDSRRQVETTPVIKPGMPGGDDPK